MSTKWVFNFDIEGVAAAYQKHGAYTLDMSMAELVSRVAPWVVSGPVDIDWSDRYGWTALTPRQFDDFITQANAAMLKANDDLNNMKYD